MEDFEKTLLNDFLGENWRSFVEFAAERGYSEDDCDLICDKLGSKS